jgi:hypothetical protein
MERQDRDGYVLAGWRKKRAKFGLGSPVVGEVVAVPRRSHYPNQRFGAVELGVGKGPGFVIGHRKKLPPPTESCCPQLFEVLWAGS